MLPTTQTISNSTYYDTSQQKANNIVLESGSKFYRIKHSTMIAKR